MAAREKPSGGGGRTPEDEPLREHGKQRGECNERDQERQRFAAWLGVEVPPYQSEEDMPAVSMAKLQALEDKRLSPLERKRILDYIAHYRSWAEAHGLVLLQRQRQR